MFTPSLSRSVAETSTPVVQSNGSIPGSSETSKQSAIDSETGGEVAPSLTTGSGSMGDGSSSCGEGGKETSDQDKVCVHSVCVVM